MINDMRSSRLIPLIVIASLGVVLILLTIRAVPPVTTILDPLKTTSEHPNPRTFHILIPANTINQNVCKVLLSSIVLGYPAPTLINYGIAFDQRQEQKQLQYGPGGSHLAKASGVAAHLAKLPSSTSEDLVLMMDGLDAWFQLRPDVLLSRYHDIVRRANDRLRQRLGPYAYTSSHASQRVLFSTQKNCRPLWPGSLGCLVVPESILSEGLYGPETDIRLDPSDDPDRNFRDRFLNSGAALGVPKDVIEVFRRAQEYSTQKVHDHLGSDQGLFADIWAEQELNRNVAVAIMQGKKKEDVPWYMAISSAPNLTYELGIGVDYESLIVLATNNRDLDTAYIQYSDVEGIAKTSSLIGMPQPRVGALPAEIAMSAAPLTTLTDHGIDGPSWEDIPLFTNVRSGFTPVVIHHNEWRHNAKERINTTWNQVWFQPYSKALFEKEYAMRNGDVSRRISARFERKFSKQKSILNLPGGELYEWEAGGGLIKTDSGENLDFANVCGSYYDVLFANQSAI